MRERRLANLTLVDGDPPDQHPAVGGVEQPGDQLGERRLPRAGLAHHRHAGPGRDGDGDVLEHVVARGVAEPHRLEGDVERAFGQVRPVDRVGHLDRGVEHLDDAAHPGRRRLRLVERLHQGLHRLDQQGHKEQHGEQGPGAEAPASTEDDPEADHPGGDGTGEDLGAGEEGGTHHEGAVLDLELGVDDRPHLGHGGRLGTVGTHHRQTRDGLAHRRHGVADPMPHLVVEPVQDPLEQHEQQSVQHHPGEHEEGEMPLEEQHHRHREHDLGDSDEQPHPAPVDEVLDGGDVGGDPCHQRPTALRLDVEHGQAVEMAEGPNPEVGEPLAAWVASRTSASRRTTIAGSIATTATAPRVSTPPTSTPAGARISLSMIRWTTTGTTIWMAVPRAASRMRHPQAVTQRRRLGQHSPQRPGRRHGRWRCS